MHGSGLRSRAASALRETTVGAAASRVRDAAAFLRSLAPHRARRGASAVLYHGVVPELQDPFVEAAHIDAALFRRQIRHLKRHRRIVPLDRIVDALASSQPIDDDWVALTFDDGYRNNLTCALEILHDEGKLPMTLFVVSDFVGSERTLPTVMLRMCILHSRAKRLRIPISGEAWKEHELHRRRARANAYWEAHRALRERTPEAQQELLDEFFAQLGDGEADEIRHRFKSYDWLSWEDLREMASHGVDIASHGRSHVSLGRSTGRERIRCEIDESRLRLRDEIGSVSNHFAYPFGGAADVCEAAVEELAENGIRAAFTAIPGVVRAGDDPFRLNRLAGCVHGIGAFRLAIATGLQ